MRHQKENGSAGKSNLIFAGAIYHGRLYRNISEGYFTADIMFGGADGNRMQPAIG